MTIPTCWYPGGVVAPDDCPCNPTAQDSTCCNSNDVCLSNNLCFSGDTNALSRGSCTDSTWRSSACAFNICNTNVKECPNDPRSFYCGLDASACGNSATFFTLQKGFFADFRSIFTTTVSPSTAATVTVSIAGSSTTVSTTVTVTAMASALSANAASDTSTSPSAPVCTPNTVTVMASASFANERASPSTPACTPNTVPLVAVGAGMGVPLGLALICALVCLFMMRKRQSRHQQGMFGYPVGAVALGSPKELHVDHARELGLSLPHEMHAG